MKFGNGTKGISKISANLIDAQLFSYKSEIIIGGDQEITISLADFSESSFVLLPRPYPHFLPYYFKRENSRNISEGEGINFLQIGIDLSHLQTGSTDAALSIERISLSK